jgi:heterodisulfide reductase subunit A
VPAALVVLAAAVLPREDAVATAAALGVPLDRDGFVHAWEPKTRAVGTLEPGVFVCGLAAGPKSSREVISQALAAAQAVLAYMRTEREIRPEERASVDARRCAARLTCVRVCPYGVPRLGERDFPPGWPCAKPHIDAARCQGCGSCVGECSAGVISLERHGEERMLRIGILGRWLPASGVGGAV